MMPTRTILPALAAGLAAVLSLGFAPDPVPVFSAPTTLTNPYAPFEPGSVKVFRGRSEGAKTTTLRRHLPETRLFPWNGGMVETVVVEEQSFEDGQLVEVSTSYLAQDDDGNVRFFGEVSLEYEQGIIVGPEPDSWLVGGPMPGDPEEVQSVDDPAMFMIADPQEGDVFSLQDLPDAQETYTVVKVGTKVKTPAGRFKSAMRVLETNDLEPGPPESVWIVPGVGIVREKGRKVRNTLLATSLVEVAPEPLD